MPFVFVLWGLIRGHPQLTSFVESLTNAYAAPLRTSRHLLMNCLDVGLSLSRGHDFLHTPLPVSIGVSAIELRRPAFLTRLMGWSAFAGFLALLLSLPITNLVASAYYKIFTEYSVARDNRVRVLNELIGSVSIKSIPFLYPATPNVCMTPD